ncbi:hypothetical protein GCM10028807_34540 [Spirosoma daeguense]
MHYKVYERIEAVRLGKTDTLELGNLDLTELPEEVYSLTNLKVLSVANLLLMSNQGIIDLLSEDQARSADTETYLEFLLEAEKELQADLLVPKQLQSIDARISQLRSLEVLDLRFNRIESLPDSIGTLPRLRRLILHDNQLTIIPESLAGLATLELLDIRNNPIQYVPNLPQLGKYNVYSEHYRLQRNEAFRQSKDIDLSIWLYRKETQYGLIQ